MPARLVQWAVAVGDVVAAVDRYQDIPVEVLDYIDGYIFLSEETPEFIAKNLVSRLKQYAETLKTPFFGALVDYATQIAPEIG